MMKTFRILFTGVGRRVELIQAFRQAANRLNVNLKLYGADMAGTAPALAFCDYTRKVCGMRDADYIPQLLRICKRIILICSYLRLILIFWCLVRTQQSLTRLGQRYLSVSRIKLQYAEIRIIRRISLNSVA